MGGRFSHQLVAPNDLLVYNTYGFNRGVQICRDLARVDVLLGLLIVRVCGSRSLIDSYKDGAAGLFLTETALWSTGPPGKPVLYNACGTRWRTRGAIDDYIPKYGNREIQGVLSGALQTLHQILRYAPNMVSDGRSRMSKFFSSVVDSVVKECRNMILIKEIELSRLIVHAQQIEDKKFKEREKKNKRAKIDPGDSLSFVTPFIAINFGVSPETLVEPFSVSSPIDISIVARQVNVVADALSKLSMGSVSHVEDDKKKLVQEVYQLVRLGVLLVDSTEGSVWVQNSLESSLIAKVKEKQDRDPNLVKLKESVRDQKVEQVKVEQQSPNRITQEFSIPTWKWEEMNMDFLIGLPHLRHQHDSIWVIVDKITKDYATVKDYAKTYIRELVRLHSVLLSIISYRGRWSGKEDHSYLEDMLRSYVINFKGSWDDHLPLIKFAYNNSYHFSIQMALFEVLYKMRYRSPIGWFKGVKRFGKKGKLSPKYVGPYRILSRYGKVAYDLELPIDLALVHPIFHVSLLKKCIGNPAIVFPLESTGVQDSLSYEEVPVEILDRQVCTLRIEARLDFDSNGTMRLHCIALGIAMSGSHIVVMLNSAFQL
ncbi:hypothetical protein FXO37_23390 [Capsicum annuum]|nr:hypothetical protein FXO37_23390 [Capsicum annuum]